MSQRDYELRLFGGFRLVSGGRELRLDSPKQQGLLAYMAVEGFGWQPRSHLAALLWGSRSEEQARLSLRQALTGIRRQCGERLVISDRERASLSPDVLHCDVVQYLRLSAEGSRESLLVATRSYGQFLRGVSIRERGFTEWQRGVEDRLAEIQVESLKKLGEQDLQTGEFSKAIEHLEAAVRLDEFREDAHCLLMRALVAAGRRSEALRHAGALTLMLERELGVGPSPATLDLVAEMRQAVVPTGLPNDVSEETERANLRRQQAADSAVFTTNGLLAESSAQQPSAARATSTSIVVLPFRYQGSDPAMNWFADGLTDDITTSLSRFHDFFVIARTSAYRLAESDAASLEVIRKLGIRYVVTGAVRIADKRVRITIELLSALDNRIIWGDQYNRQLDDIFAVLDDITQLIAFATAVYIEASERDRLQQLAPADLKAYGFVLQGQQHVFRYTRDDNRRARMLYERALDVDPRYARAIAGKSRTLNIDWRYSWTESRDKALDAALELALEATALNPFDARGFGELGFAHLYRNEHEAALSAYRQALRLNPNNADLMSDMADALNHSGRSVEALPLLYRALELNPFCPDQYLWHLGGSYYRLKRYEDAIQALRKMQNVTQGRRLLAASYAQLGLLDEARFQAARVLEAHPGFRAEEWAAILPDKSEAERAHFVEGLRKAGL